jgi:hypothetical protein
MYFY